MDDQPHNGLTPRPVVFGETLFDCFPDGSRVLGGAPFNVSWHLQGFGQAPLLISAVGDDPLGAEIRQAMADWDMDLSGLQTVTAATGTVQVSLDHGEPSFDIVPECAWDHIDRDIARALIQPQAVLLLYHGSLALRSHTSRIALEALRDGLALPTAVDANLRSPWWQAGILSESLTQATWGKLNRHELEQACAAEGLPRADVATMARNLRARHGLTLLVITEGELGATLVTRDEVIHETPARATEVVDTVGAGDAFSAVLIIGIIEDWPLPLMLRRALNFAAGVVAHRGSISKDREVYQRQMDAWQRDGC